MTRRYAVGVIVLTFLMLVGAVGFNVQYTASVQRQTERRFAVQQQQANRRYAAEQAKAEAERRATNRLWCELFIAIDPKQTPPTTDRAREVQQRIGRLRNNLGCD